MGKRGRPKRLANSPVEAAAKESRKENDNEETIPPVASIIEKLNKQSSERGSVIVQSEKKKGGSVIDFLNERASVRGSVNGSVRGEPTKRSLAPTSLYKTPPPEGCMRDVLNIAVLSRNEEEYRGTVTYNEAKYEIFLKSLDLPEDLLHGIKIQFGKGPNISFKLTEQIDIDDLSELEFFEFERHITTNGVSRTETFQCKIKGIRQRRPQVGEQQDHRGMSEEPNVFNVRVIGCDYSIEEEEILEWLRMYGETFGKLNENFYYDPNPSAKPTGDGTYTVKMRIDKQIPQFLPMHGKKSQDRAPLHPNPLHKLLWETPEKSLQVGKGQVDGLRGTIHGSQPGYLQQHDREMVRHSDGREKNPSPEQKTDRGIQAT